MSRRLSDRRLKRAEKIGRRLDARRKGAINATVDAFAATPQPEFVGELGTNAMQQGPFLSKEALLDLVAGARFELATFGL